MYTVKTASAILKLKRNMKGWTMDNGDQIQQTNLVSDDTAAAMSDGATAVQATPSPTTAQPQTDPIPTGSAADPIAPPVTPTDDTPPVVEPVNMTASATSIDKSTSVTSDPDPTSTTPIAEETSVSDTNYAELDEIKRSALDELKPLIEHVEQAPEERFETIMMMIRSNDDPKLIPTAYEAAKRIENEKTRASALLNIVSEIEYLKSKA